MLAPWPRLRPRSRAPRVTPAETYRPGVARAPPARRRARGARTIMIIATEYSRSRSARRARPTDGRASVARPRRARDRATDPQTRVPNAPKPSCGRPRPLYKTLCSARTTLRIAVGAPCSTRPRPCRLPFCGDRPPLHCYTKRKNGTQSHREYSYRHSQSRFRPVIARPPGTG